MGISKATIRTTDKYVIIDATVDGILRDGFVLYDGNTREHENAALEYLVTSVKLSISAIDFVDDRRPTVDLTELAEFFPVEDDDDAWTGREYAGYSHAAGYHN